MRVCCARARVATTGNRAGGNTKTEHVCILCTLRPNTLYKFPKLLRGLLLPVHPPPPLSSTLPPSPTLPYPPPLLHIHPHTQLHTQLHPLLRSALLRKISRDQARRMFEKMDSDHNNRIDYDEFVKAIALFEVGAEAVSTQGGGERDGEEEEKEGARNSSIRGVHEAWGDL